jgi:hypothetical protein
MPPAKCIVTLLLGSSSYVLYDLWEHPSKNLLHMGYDATPLSNFSQANWQ